MKVRTLLFTQVKKDFSQEKFEIGLYTKDNNNLSTKQVWLKIENKR